MIMKCLQKIWDAFLELCMLADEAPARFNGAEECEKCGKGVYKHPPAMNEGYVDALNYGAVLAASTAPLVCSRCGQPKR